MKTIKSLAIGSAFLLIFVSCQGQNQQDKKSLFSEPSAHNSSSQHDSLYKPKINIKVNKQFDDKGNIVRFDSTYSYSYSSPNGMKDLNNDSIFKNFHSFFNHKYSGLIEQQNNSIFFNDSLFKYDFFNNDYFQKRFELNQKMFEQLFKDMDSIKKDYMQENYPNGKNKKKTI